MIQPTIDAAAAALLSWLLTYAIHSTLLLGAAAIAAWRLRDHHAVLDVMWKAAVVAPLLTATIELDAISPRWSRRLDMPATTSVAAVVPVAERPSFGGRASSGPTTITAVAPRDRIEETSDAAPPVIDRAAAGGVLNRWPLIAVMMWASIAAVGIARYGLRIRRVHRVFATGVPIESAMIAGAVDEWRGHMPRRPAIRVTTNAACRVPLALSGGHIVLPPEFFDQLDADQQRAALAHECAHVCRRDPEWRIGLELIERALFFQPLNRLARMRSGDAAEFLCDEWAVRQTGLPLALARCLAVVASWWTPADTMPAGVSAMARSDSAMVRRVTRILDAPAAAARPRLFWLAIPVAVVVFAAPRVAATQVPAPAIASAVVTSLLSAAPEDGQRESRRQWTAAEMAAAQSQMRVTRLDRAGASLEDRWRQALAEAGRQGGDFWIAYAFHTAAHGDGGTIADSRDGGIVISDGRVSTQGPPLSGLINAAGVALEGGNLVVLLHYRSARADAIDRAGYRSPQFGFDFGRTPVFWLGHASDADSFARVTSLFAQSRDREIQTLLIELASLHADANAVIPFLARLVEPSWPAEIRSEAAEGFEHQHDPRSVEILVRVARNDADAEVRSEAAETIGDVQVPQSIPALLDLIDRSPDPTVRHEAAEGLATQPADRALPAIEHVLANTSDTEVMNEAVEALGEIDDAGAVPLLVRIAMTHANVTVQEEAVETLGDRRNDAAAIAAVERIAREHASEQVQVEAIETLTDLDAHALHPLLIELAASGRSAPIRKEALSAIGDAVQKIGDVQLLDRAQQALERAIFDDPDRDVQLEALDAVDELATDRAVRTLRDVIARHPDARVRREAEEHLRERQ